MKNIMVSTIVVVVIYILYQTLPWLFLYLSIENAPDPPPPSITKAEFPIKIEYELDGELKVLEDVIVCEFGGYKSLGEAGKYRIWNSHLKSGNERLTLLKISENEQVYFKNRIPEYYMNDLVSQTIEQYDSHTRRIYYIKVNPGEYIYPEELTDEELLNKYSIRIIKIEEARPLGEGLEISKKDITNNLLEQIPLDKIQEENLATNNEK